MQPNRFSTALYDMVKSSFSDIHTIVPAKLTAVDYGTGRASAQPLVKNYIGLNKSQSYPQLMEVPLVIASGNAGKASMTFPIKSGDTVLVLFSERDPSAALQGNGDTESNPVQTDPLGLYPIGILPCIFTQSGAKEIDPEKVVINNEEAIITLSKEGDILIENPEGSISLSASGDIILKRGNQTFSMSSSGLQINSPSINLNGLIIDSSGKLTDGAGLSFTNHKHTGVETGGGTSGKPTN